MSPPPPVAADTISTITMNPETASCSGSSPPRRRFGELRGVQWRIDLGILPSSQSASIDDLRRVTANSRRRYAALRRQLLVDPHVPKDGSNSPDLVIDNPLSQNPDSMWGRFFRNAELERMVDQDLTRLYPKRGSYFQTTGCQGMLRRILLLWCLRHPEYGYGQGMHELLAPLLYVLHEDVERLSEVRKVYDDHFADKFDGFSFHEDDLTYKFDFKKFSDSEGDGTGFENSFTKPSTLSELDPEIQNIVSLSDAYGAEGELGIVLSEKFMEHDAYSMFDALMSGASGAVAMAEFFSPSPFKSSHSGFPPVIEASAAMYHLLSIVDSSLHSHLVELGVEPQYFALRWLRVLFGREFSLEDLLVIWDEIFACENTKSTKDGDSDAESSFGVLESPRGAFISAFAVSMILYLRSSLFATENATVCLQRLLNFPNDVKLDKLVVKAKSLQSLAMDTKNSSSLSIYHELYNRKKPVITRGHSLSMDSTSPGTPLNMVSESYWEEKWRVLHKEEEKKKSAVGEEQVQKQQRGWSERVKIRLSRTESDPSPSSKNGINKRIPKPSVRRSLLEDLARQLGSDEVKENSGVNKDIGHKDPEEFNDGQDSSGKLLARLLGSDEVEQKSEINEDIDHQDSVENNGRDSSGKNLVATLSGAGSEENSSNYSDPQSSIHGESGHENESGRSSVASNSTFGENYSEPLCGTAQECSPLPVSDPPDEGLSSTRAQNDDSVEKSEKGMKERNFLSGKFQWLWKFARNGDEGTSERINAPEDAKAIKGGSVQSNLAGICHGNGSDNSFATSKGDSVDQNLMDSLKNLGQSMLENIQVIESAFQQEHRGHTENLSKNGIVGKGQVTAMAALKELRKMSNLLSEM